MLSSSEAAFRYDVQEVVFLINQRSQRVAIRVPTDSTISDTGAVVPRISLIRPTEKVKLTLPELEQTSWQVVSFPEWQRRWDEEVAQTPQLVRDRFFLICGLLLPIWKKIDSGSMRVYRLETSESERLLGRMVDTHRMVQLADSLGLHHVKLSSREIYDLVMARRESYPLSGGLSLRASAVMGTMRLEVAGSISEALGSQLKAAGCFTEIISWRTRYFIPVNEMSALRVIEQVMSLTV